MRVRIAFGIVLVMVLSFSTAGQELPIAVGPADETTPAISGTVYPWPEFDAANGYIKNNSWPWFTSWLQNQINSGAVWSRITEFGWNPGQMDRTGKTQRSSVWGNDGRWHTFCPDTQGFINNERRNAYGVMVFLVQSTDPALAKHDGLDDNGNPYYWFSCYRSW